MPSQWRLFRAAAYASRHAISAAPTSLRASAASILWRCARHASCASVPRAWSANKSMAMTTTTISVASEATARTSEVCEPSDRSFTDTLWALLEGKPDTIGEASKNSRLHHRTNGVQISGGQELNTSLTDRKMRRVKHLADLIGDSPSIEAIRERVARLLQRQGDLRRLPPVLIEGETGTGKGLLARMIHKAGPRADGPFVDVNCAAIPETLLEAEMFGFERGAFTDARRAKPGLFQTANRGTIFLDEVALLSEGLQAKLLKVLEERSVRRLGSTRDEPIDVWILTATNEDLKAAIPARRFREDLYHRLAVLTLTLPPLRSRGDDILLLAEHYLGRACADYSVSAKSLSADARAALRAYPWPGNVRELANLMERVVLLSSEPEVTADALGLTPVAEPEPAAPPPAGGAAGGASSLDDAVRDRVAEVLRQTSWNISRTAAVLGISRNTLRARIEKYGLRSGEAPAPA